jgi:NAD(P)-dependent dehydrogenase (short-subunit alcohol dehydrogenase family)
MRDEVAIVTGGASGIGAAIAAELAGRGARVVIADVQRPLAEALAGRLAAAGGKVEVVDLDVRDASAIAALFEDVAARHGRLDWVFNNAGVAIYGPARLHEPGDVERILRINVDAVIHGSIAAARIMVRAGRGRIVNTASAAGLVSVPTIAVYSATKHAVVGFGRAFHAEMAPLGVSVTTVCPAGVRTPILTGGAFGKGSVQLDKDLMLSTWEKTGLLEPDWLARRVVDGALAGEEYIVAPFSARVGIWIGRTFPAFGRLVARLLWAGARRAPAMAAVERGPDYGMPPRE